MIKIVRTLSDRVFCSGYKTVKWSEVLVTHLCPIFVTPWTVACHGYSLLCPWNSPGKNTEIGSHSLFQGIFLTQGLNPGLLHCRQIIYCLNLEGSPPRGLVSEIWLANTEEVHAFHDKNISSWYLLRTCYVPSNMHAYSAAGKMESQSRKENVSSW